MQNIFVAKEQLTGVKVGDRLPNGAKVINVQYVKQGAIGFEIDNPEIIARIEKALADYAAAVRKDQLRPREESPRRNLYFDSPLD
ncbi:MAG: hypothetical protein UU34_C0017G0014 [Candidatus Curtissbacteria bacterium GW2011_GWA1_41_11]|uniref:Uncharacterized protein n=1 Tax=Candidatus Curtissbacteria bacterium GW2011_GWA1_41_11 TaxID=1618409 RepID=A0A0G0UBF8_9BACT|nr:MAG: hypothetical protein UU34_C0017G0014 [Candidatus Curtissbacteria bacterium GW2011_GWA1_41_11]